MSEHISYPANPETRGTAPAQFFEDAGGTPPAGTKATPRPADRPREVPSSAPGRPADDCSTTAATTPASEPGRRG